MTLYCNEWELKYLITSFIITLGLEMLQLWTWKKDCPEDSEGEDFISEVVLPKQLQSFCSNSFCRNKVL